MYQAEITFNDDTGYDEAFPTLKEAVDFIEHWVTGRDICRGWINNKHLSLRHGKVMGSDGLPICLNEHYHEVFATAEERIPAKPFRPMTCRPTNPLTLGLL